MEHLTLLVLLLAVAAGLVTITRAAQLAQDRRTAFFRSFLANILLFDLLIVLALALRYLQIHTDLGLVIVVILAIMAVPKLGWACAFVAMNRLLLGEEVTARITRSCLVIGGAMLAASWVLLTAGVATGREGLIGIGAWAVDAPVIVAALGAASDLLVRARRLPVSPRRRSLTAFGGLHLLLLVALAGSILLGGLHEVVSGVIMILYNLLPLAWMHSYLPMGPEALAGQIDRYGITPREREIIDLVRAGRTNQEIADQLFISLPTVKDHNYNIFRKTGVRNRVELVNLFRDQGWQGSG